MSSDVFKQFEDQFGDEWKCSCGSDWVEVVSKTKSTLLARYSCQICGREQIFAISTDIEQGLFEVPTMDIPSRSINSDDVLDIRTEARKISFNQIRAIGKRKSKTRITASKISRK